ncbi:MAG: alpha/beta hydrolase [Cyanobacteria bacterium P01_A01_bin.84]
MTAVRKTLSHQGIEISYLEWNQESKQGKEPLLLLHGLADHGLVWTSLGDSLASRYHIIAPDLRGHGESSKPEDDYTFVSIVADLEALMDSVGWKSCHVVAHSWSGKLAAIWARQNPSILLSMVLVDPIFIWKMPSFLKLTFPFLYRVLSFLKGMGPFSSYSEAEKQARQMYEYQGWTPLQQEVFKNGIEQKADGTWGSKFTINARDHIFDEVLKIAGLTVPLEVPCLFIQPEKGLNRQEWQLKPYKKYLKNLKITKVPGNHWAFLTQPKTFNQVISAFLEEHLQ